MAPLAGSTNAAIPVVEEDAMMAQSPAAPKTVVSNSTSARGRKRHSSEHEEAEHRAVPRFKAVPAEAAPTGGMAETASVGSRGTGPGAESEAVPAGTRSSQSHSEEVGMNCDLSVTRR